MIKQKIKKDEAIRSPLFYVGDKYKLMPQLSKLFPINIENYVEPFVGGGSSFINTKAEKYFLNDIDPWIIKIHKKLNEYTNDVDTLFNELFEIIDDYGLTCTFCGKDVPDGYRQKYVKTYFAKANKEAYLKLRNDFNKNKDDILKLYTLLIYGFNHMIRFNGVGNFNLPVGNVDFNKNVSEALWNYMVFCKDASLSFYNMDYKDFLANIDLSMGDTYIYFDPPYLISGSEYNKLWSEQDERELYQLIDAIDKMGIKFGLTNLVNHKGKTNDILTEWSKKYQVYNVNSNYISFNDNSIKNNSKEIFVTNYGKK